MALNPNWKFSAEACGQLKALHWPCLLVISIFSHLSSAKYGGHHLSPTCPLSLFKHRVIKKNPVSLLSITKFMMGVCAKPFSWDLRHNEIHFSVNLDPSPLIFMTEKCQILEAITWTRARIGPFLIEAIQASRWWVLSVLSEDIWAALNHSSCFQDLTQKCKATKTQALGTCVIGACSTVGTACH